MSTSGYIETQEMRDKIKARFPENPKIKKTIRAMIRDREELNLPTTEIIEEGIWEQLGPSELLDNPPKDLLAAFEKVKKYGDWLYIYLHEIRKEQVKERNIKK